QGRDTGSNPVGGANSHQELLTGTSAENPVIRRRASRLKVMLRIPILIGILCAGPAAARNGEVANPEHDRWSGFKPGSWVKFEQPCGKGALMQEPYKLLEFSAEQAVLECTKVENGFQYP